MHKNLQSMKAIHFYFILFCFVHHKLIDQELRAEIITQQKIENNYNYLHSNRQVKKRYLSLLPP